MAVVVNTFMVPYEGKCRIITAFNESNHRMTISLSKRTLRHIPQIIEHVPQMYTPEFNTLFVTTKR